ncbi:PrsW family intramembrane metalloprotease [Streptomyces sp. A7024]|uniref:PrsW family intramembrane metalloprotease n=2 Tax=Streptomyces coryli TaxID=1128680 RepID=A0A6G4UCW5_9ACTN|nr:PrsW family intramembrane metalloprotease [Streptomyces coryli]
MLAMLRSETGTHGLLVGISLAVLPVPILLAAFRWLDRVEPKPWPNLAFAFAWGACAATTVAMLANRFAARWLETGLPPDSAQNADLWGAAFVAPIVEESAKAGAICLLFLYRRRTYGSLADGVVIAGITATGFAFTENILYLGTAFDSDQSLGLSGLFSSTAATFFVRGVMSPFAHPLFTILTGIGVGLAASAPRHCKVRRVVFPLAGLVLAMILHGVWNSAASMSGLGFFLVYALVMFPLFAGAVALGVRVRQHELRVVRDHLPAYVPEGWLTAEEPEALASMRTRRKARALATRDHGPGGARAVREYESYATTLAFLRARAEQGAPRRDHEARERELLESMWTLSPEAQPALLEALSLCDADTHDWNDAAFAPSTAEDFGPAR